MRVDTIRSKIRGAEPLKRILEDVRKKRKTIVFTNGCFDILHPGHINYLKKSKSLGDILIIGLNSDSSVRKLKGKGRPITTQKKRAEMLASLEFVDFVAVFNELTPIKLIKKIKPHVLVKGADWKKKDVAGKRFVESYGGRVRRLPYIKGYSTTSLIKAICRKFGK